MSPYQLLGVPRDANELQIRAAWKEAAKEWHPDRRKDAGKRMARINDAAETLLNPARRAALDAALARESLPVAKRRTARRTATKRKPRPRAQPVPPPPSPPQPVPSPEPPPGLFLNLAGSYVRDKPIPEMVFWMFMGALVDREPGTDRVKPPNIPR